MNNRLLTVALLKDIRFWIIFFFVIRLYGITFPPLEVGHNWRQTDGLMIARNFYENDSNILYPRVDLAGEKTGIVGCEFPILNYLVFLVAKVLGYEHWYGRIVVLIFSSIGIYFFYRLVRKYFGEASAFNAAIIMLASLWFSYSRKNIPDAFAVSLCLIALYYALKYFDSGKVWQLLLFFVLALFGCLSKIFAATILTVLLLPILSSQYTMGRKVWISIFSATILVVVSLWYFIWVPYLNATFDFSGHFSMGYPYIDAAKDFFLNLPIILKRFYETPLKYIGFTLFICSFLYISWKKNWLALSVFLIPFTFYVILLLKTGSSIIGDKYYIITVIPPMAFLAGYGLSHLKNKRIAFVILIAITVEGTADQIYDFRIRQPFKSLADLEPIMDKISSRSDLIVVNAEYHNPTAIYFTHRKGWVAPNSFLENANNIDDIHQKGCKYIVIVKQLYGDLGLHYPVVFESEYFKIYKL